MQLNKAISMLMLAVVASLGLSSPLAAQTFMSNEIVAAGGENQINVDIIRTTATNWELQMWDGTQWVTIQEGNAQGAGDFQEALNADMIAGKKYRVRGNTSGMSGPYSAVLTASTV